MDGSEQGKGDLPRIFIAGDSTAAPGNGMDQVGWAEPFASFFDKEKVEIANKARGGRSSRTFITEGHWDRMLLELRAGDVVLIQFGHNDSGAVNREPAGSGRPLRARGSLPGLGKDSVDIVNAATGREETVYTYGHYLSKMIADTKEKGAQPVLLSLTLRNIWKSGRVERGSGMYGAWSYELANTLGIPFVDITSSVAERLEPLGEVAMAEYYPNDHTHTNLEGAEIHAEEVVSGLKGLRPSPVEGWLSSRGEAVDADTMTWLNLPSPANASLPSLFLIGDSTVRNGRGDGSNGEWGWGDYLDSYFDKGKINIVNRAVGGLSSRTYYTQTHWKRVREMLKPGDFVVMQFGHNDNIALNDAKRARGTIKGVGEETETIDNLVTHQREVVHTYGWYLRQYIKEIRGLGATPIVCSLVPRKIWTEEGRIQRNVGSYADWAKQVAREENADFVDLHHVVADRYDTSGRKAVESLFADAHTHTSLDGAKVNAQCVADGIRSLKTSGLRRFMTVNVGDGRPYRFVFGNDENKTNGTIYVAPDCEYGEENGYGYDLGSMPGQGAFCFSVLAADGNYRLTIEFGDESEASSNTVKVESRRLLLENVETPKGQFLIRSAVANVRNEKLEPPEAFAPGGTSVVLNDREVGILRWDDKLTIEFNGKSPSVRSFEIERVDVPTVYLIGDSTVTDQPREPSASWGQMLSRYFKDKVAISNHAESGETMKSFMSGLRLAKVLQTMKAGDYLFIQFTHNDQKKQWPQTYVEAESTYKAYLKVFIAETHLRGATPVLVTSVQRRRFDSEGKVVSSLGDYPEAMRTVAMEEGVALIDLERMSVELYEALGPEKAPMAFSNGGKDATHHNNYGAYQLAQCVAQGIRDTGLGLAEALLDDFRGYDPKFPDDVDTFYLSPSPAWSDLKPLGN